MAAERAAVEIAQLVAEHHAAIYRYAYRLTGSVPDAEDLTQQVFLAAQEKLGQLRCAENARAWLFAMLRNAFGKMCRKPRPKSAGACEVDLDNLPGAVPDDDAIDREQLQGALNELPPSYRMVVMMFYFEDCSYRQIADQLDLPMGTVMSRLARAKAHLRSRLFVPGPVSSRLPQRRIVGKRG
jgi:RNA polymerase sigma-70 factor (ECF subfamily)